MVKNLIIASNSLVIQIIEDKYIKNVKIINFKSFMGSN